MKSVEERVREKAEKVREVVAATSAGREHGCDSEGSETPWAVLKRLRESWSAWASWDK